MRFVSLLIIALLINSCTSEEQIHDEKYIKEIIEDDWNDGIPFDDLLNVSNICKKHSDYEGCSIVDEQIADISISLQSCLIDRRSRLCQAVVLVISKHPISKVLPILEPVDLPSNPFYWNMPTQALEAQSSHFDYRTESTGWWWKKWKTVILFITIFLLFAFGSFRYWIYRNKIQLEITLDNKAKIALQMEAETSLAKQVQQEKRVQALRLEAEREAELAKQKLFEEENRIMLEVKVANEKSEKLAKEKAEADALLNAVFKRKN
jgi:hypothetical protein